MAPDAPVSEEPAPRPLTGGAVMSAVSRVSVAVTGAATTILIARLLGPAGAGSYSIALTVVLMLTVLSTLGVEHGVAYYVSSGRWPARRAFASSQVVALVAGVVAAGLGVLARVVAPSAFAELSVGEVALAAAAMPCALSWFYASYIALSVDRYEAYVVPAALQSAAALVFVSVGAAVDDLHGAIIGLLASNVLAALVTLAWAGRWLPPDHGAPEEGMLRRAVGFGVKGYAANALQFFNYRLDLFILSAVTSSAAVGRYSVAVAVTSVMWLLPPALSDVLFPRVAALGARGEEAEAHREMVEVKSMRHTVVIVAGSAIVVALALLFLVEPVYGERFGDATHLGLILLPGVALIGLSGVLSATIVGRGRPEYSLYSALITTPVTVVLYVVLIPALDASGAALASSISYALNFVLATIFYRRVTGRGVLGAMRPTADELADYRGLLGRRA